MSMGDDCTGCRKLVDTLQRAGFGLLALLFLVSFISKAAINIVYGLLMVVTLAYILRYKRFDFLKDGLMPVFLAPLFAGLVLSLFSAAGWSGPVALLREFRFMLVMIPLYLFVKNRGDYHILIGAVLISALTGVAYGLITGQAVGLGEFCGLHRVGRNADMLMVVILALTVHIFFRFGTEKKVWACKFLLFVTGVILFWALVMSSIRGAWLGLFIGGVFFSVFYQRKLLILIVIGAALFVFSDGMGAIKGEIISIKDTKVNESNIARLSLWRTGIEFSTAQLFFGTGVDNSKDKFIDFFESKPEEWQQKYHWALVYAGNYHNSYLQMFVDSGLFLFIIYMLSLCYILLVMANRIRFLNGIEKTYVVGALVVSCGFLVTQLFHGELFSYGVLLYYLFLFGAFFVERSGWGGGEQLPA